MEFFVFLNKLAIFAKCDECSIGRIHYDFSAPRCGDIALKTRKKCLALFNCFYFLLHFCEYVLCTYLIMEYCVFKEVFC